MSVEREDLPTMSDMCYGDDHCEECQDYNYPEPCPCGQSTTESDPCPVCGAPGGGCEVCKIELRCDHD